MKKIFLGAVCLMLFASTSWATGLFGPATPAAPQGSVTLGPGIFLYNAEYDSDENVDQLQAYVQLGYSVTDNVEIYLQAGGADLDIDNVFGSGEEFDDGHRPFGALGVKALLAERKSFSLGCFLQGSYFDDYEDEIPTQKLEYTGNYEVNGGLVLQTVLEGAILYGGPIFYVHEGDRDHSTFGSSTYEEDGNLGVFVGIRWPLKNGINVDLEGQLKTEFSGGGAIHFSF